MESTYTAFISLGDRPVDGEAFHVMKNAHVSINGSNTIPHPGPFSERESAAGQHYCYTTWFLLITDYE